MDRPTVWRQIKANSVALISLFLALTSLGYITWRNETSEVNRNTRIAAFEVLKNLGELQMVVNYAFYEHDNQLGNPFAGWGRVLLIRDLSRLLPDPAPQAAERLAQVWQAESKSIQVDENSVDRITAEIDADRQTLLVILARLK